jgi:hypothetical protein
MRPSWQRRKWRRIQPWDSRWPPGSSAHRWAPWLGTAWSRQSTRPPCCASWRRHKCEEKSEVIYKLKDKGGILLEKLDISNAAKIVKDSEIKELNIKNWNLVAENKTLRSDFK